MIKILHTIVIGLMALLGTLNHKPILAGTDPVSPDPTPAPTEQVINLVNDKASIEMTDTISKVDTSSVALDPQTDTITVKIPRPTTANPIAWDSKTKIHVAIIINIDGKEVRADGSTSGGIRYQNVATTTVVNGIATTTIVQEELPFYSISYTPTFGHFDEGKNKRLGETALINYDYKVEITRGTTGDIPIDLETTSTVNPAPDFPTHHSVAYSLGTVSVENGGDGIISYTHSEPAGAPTPNPAAIVCNESNNATDRTSTSVTYGGTTMTEKWDSISDAGGYTSSGNILAGIATGNQTVVSTLSGAVTTDQVGTVTMTGVNQTTPVGTAVTNALGFGSNPSVTVATPGANDMVMDCLSGGSTTPTADAGQTVRATSDLNGSAIRMSSQPGSAGGLMSWTTAAQHWFLGAINFIAAPSTATGPLFKMTQDKNFSVTQSKSFKETR